MKKGKKIVLTILFVLLVPIAWGAYFAYRETTKAFSEDPLVWEDTIREFELQGERYSEPENAVVFVGSSSIRFWSTLKEDMYPIPVIQRGFGGAKLRDVAHYAKRLVNVHDPSAIVVFAGTNDIHPGYAKSPETLMQTYREFVGTVRRDLPTVPIYFIAITPSITRWEVWDIAQDTNALIQAYSATDETLHVIDTTEVLLGADGLPDEKNYKIDGLHLSEQGYKVWARVIREHLKEYATL
ncbi:MAG: GDSL-type esterase/lipase family protein [Pseudomonadota bacterium]